MSWIPSEEETKYLVLVIGMSLDCLQQKGTESLAAYVSNLRMICDKMMDKAKDD